VKCKFCSYQTANRQFMVIHIRNNHRSKVESLPSANCYSSVDLHDDNLLENLALASLYVFCDEESRPAFEGGGGSFDGGGASDSYDSGSGSSYSSSDSSSSSDSGSSGGSDY
jgi:hypothetical protein